MVNMFNIKKEGRDFKEFRNWIVHYNPGKH